MVTDVTDEAGNVALPVTWSFQYGDFGASDASVHVSGLVLDTIYEAFIAKSGEIARVIAEVASFLGVAASRIVSMQAFSALGGNATALSFTVLAPTNAGGDTKTAVVLAQTLAVETVKDSHSFEGALATLIKSKVARVIQILVLM